VAVVKTIDLVGVSTDSWHHAAKEALAEASKTLRGIESMDVLETSCTIVDNGIAEYLAHVRIKFRIER
jgi:flavin-binding protein dodecin